MKELMENGPVQGECPSSCPLIPPGPAAHVFCTALSSRSTGAGCGGTMSPPHGQHLVGEAAGRGVRLHSGFGAGADG